MGRTFGYWKVLSLAYKTDRHILYYHCRCKCGNEKDVKKYNLVHGKSISCGCYSKEIGHSLRFKSLVGKTFGNLFVSGIDHKEGSSYFYVCKCSCGNIVVVRGVSLTKKKNPTRSCGCLHKSVQDITNQKFGHLLVFDFSCRKNNHTYWKCKCDCGNVVEVESSHLKSGHTISCGCLDISHRGSKAENEIRMYIDSLIGVNYNGKSKKE